ncbi:MAG: hypothetical protein SGJ27_04465, partial [Candidatus Melainabacteria bacterium]|nr:hypothetical protein [Candidatus Melainabacteria bacterium]
MSCNEYRYIIQHRFDEDLDQDDVNSVDDHIDACESCAKFEHQLDQMIQGAEEMPLPEELTPPNPEALAKMVQDKLPQQKSSVFSMFANMFGGSSGGNSAKATKTRISDKKTEFPKRAAKGAPPEKHRNAQEAADDKDMSSRLKSLAREPEESRDVQSTTKGLGEKFGFGSNALSPQDAATPLTLAESIRRKISESQKISVDEEDGGGIASEDRLSPAAAGGGQDNWNQPIKMPGGQAQPDAGWTPQGGPPANNWTPQGAQQQPPPGGQPNDIGLTPGSEGWSADQRAPKGTSSGDEDAGWGPPPAGGAWEDPTGGAGAGQNPGQNPNFQASQAAQSGAWDGVPNGGAPPPQGGQNPDGSWGAGAQASWANSPSPTQPTSDQFGSGGWNVPSAKANQTSAPVAEGPPQNANANWDGAPGGGAVNSWGGAPQSEPAGAKGAGGWSEG